MAVYAKLSMGNKNVFLHKPQQLHYQPPLKLVTHHALLIANAGLFMENQHVL
uniref:Uncharacterized protein n=1 Tax=Meloidogyne enterolobii TaxID=390850 RepID=A0A6V7TRY2_MELEN|nr:unnamed protein product [Meloidogyne enterolobii]